MGIWGSNRNLQCVEARGGYMGFKPDHPMFIGRGWVYGVQTGPSNVKRQGVGIWGWRQRVGAEEVIWGLNGPSNPPR